MTFRLEKIGFAYEARHQERNEVFRELDLAVASGESVALMGVEGCGKSTLLGILGGMLRPFTGNVVIDGVNVWSAPRKKSGANIGWTFQSPDHQFLCATVAEEFRAMPHLPPSYEDQIRSALATVGLEYETFCERSPFTLSLGESRRCALALALFTHPRALLLDEPTSGLDGDGIDHTISALRQARQAGTTLITATHDLDFAKEVAKRVVILESGRTAADGKAEEVLGRKEIVESFGYV